MNTKINSFGWRIKLKKQNHNKLEENRGNHLPVLRIRESLSKHKRKAENIKGDRFDYKMFKTSVWKKFKKKIAKLKCK